MTRSPLELYERQLATKTMLEHFKESDLLKSRNIEPTVLVDLAIKLSDETKGMDKNKRIEIISEKIAEFLSSPKEEPKELEPLKDEDWIVSNPEIKEKRTPLPSYAIGVVEEIVSGQAIEDVIETHNLKPNMIVNILELTHKRLGSTVMEDLITNDIRNKISTSIEKHDTKPEKIEILDDSKKEAKIHYLSPKIIEKAA